MTSSPFPLRGLAFALGVLLYGAMTPLPGAAEPAAPEPSRLVLRSVCKPVFTIDGVARPSGTGFLLETLAGRRRTYLVTAQHLFSFAPAEVAAHVTRAQCTPPASSATFLTGPAIPIPGAHPVGSPSDFKDVAIFPVLGHSPGLPLAQIDVGPGDWVWLLAKPASGREVNTLLHRARVLRTEGFLAYRYDDQTLGPDQTSGAAIINAAGEVVGLNVGYARDANGDLVGVGDRLSTLRSVMSALPHEASKHSSDD